MQFVAIDRINCKPDISLLSYSGSQIIIIMLYRFLRYVMCLYHRIPQLHPQLCMLALGKTGKRLIREIPYILEFFLWVLLISECAIVRIQFAGGNKTRAGTINITTLLCSYAHCAPSRFSLKSTLDHA